jgi:hypothetical protein
MSTLRWAVHVRRVLAFALACVPAVHGQARFDTTAAKAYTIGALLDGARATAALLQRDVASQRAVRWVDTLLLRLDRERVARLPLMALVRTPQRFGTGRTAAFGRVARFRRTTDVAGLGAGDAADLDTLTRLTLAELRLAVERQRLVSNDSVDALLAPFTALHREQLAVSITTSLEKLNRFERKYGPGSPRLNLAEVGLNYVAQWVPAMRPTADGWPSRWEVVTSYVPTYLTIADKGVRAVTVGEVGLRAYLWKRGWGGADGGVLRPGYVSFGLAAAGDQNGAFVSPLRGTTRLGAFVGWGETKVAYVGGRDRRVLVTRQLQVLPWIF